MITKGEMPVNAVKGFEGENKKRSWAGKGSDFLNLSADKLRKGFKLLQQCGTFFMANSAHSERIDKVLKIGTMQNLEGVKAKLAGAKELPFAEVVKVSDVVKKPIGKDLGR